MNKVKNRAELPNMIPKYYANKDIFFEEIIRERAVELMYEDYVRFNDLRRWNRYMDPRYKTKTGIRFARNFDTGKPYNIREVPLVERVVEKKHKWLPLQDAWVTKYKNFPQNPGY